MGFFKYDATPANNSSVGAIGSQGSSQANNIDDLVRQIVADAKRYTLDVGGANTVSGTDTILVTLNDTTATQYFDGMTFGFVAAGTTTITGVTLNANSIGAKTIKKAVAGAETALAVGDIKSGQLYQVRYRSSWASSAGAWQLIALGDILPQDLRTTASPTFDDLIITDDLTIGGTPTVNGSGGGQSGLHLHQFSNDALFPYINFRKSRNATVDGQTIVNSGDTVGGVYFGASDGSTYRNAAAITALINGTPGASDMPGALLFFTTPDGSATPTERFAITSTGAWNIGGATGVNGQVLKQVSGITAWGAIGTTIGPIATTSGSSVDLAVGTIPSWIQEIDIIFDGVSSSAANGVIIQLGDAGGWETTSYESQSNMTYSAGTTGYSSTSGFLVGSNSAGHVYRGMMYLRKVPGTNTWIQSHTVMCDTASISYGGGKKTVSETLNSLRISSVSGNMDLGAVSLIYR